MVSTPGTAGGPPPTTTTSPNPPPTRPSAKRPTGALMDTPPSLRGRFDLADEPLHKASYLFTREELEALEDIKLELQRSLDTKVTKNDVARCAFQMLFEDYRANGARSYVTRKIRQRPND
jgi:hypothetical protein